MARRFPLQTLLDLARDRSDAAAKNLSILKARWAEAEDRLQQLLGYAEEYRRRLHRSAQTGMSASVMRDFQHFLGKLDLAVSQQRAEVGRCQAQWEEGQREWVRQKNKLNAYDTLSKRHQQKEMMAEARAEQREQDEYARRLFADKASAREQQVEQPEEGEP